MKLYREVFKPDGRAERGVDVIDDEYIGEALKYVKCPQCRKNFQLVWNDYTEGVSFRCKRQTLILRGCPSGGIYDVGIQCPHCDYYEEL